MSVFHVAEEMVHDIALNLPPEIADVEWPQYVEVRDMEWPQCVEVRDMEWLLCVEVRDLTR